MGLLLITDINDDRVTPIYEDAGEGQPKKLFIEGIFLMSNIKNRNGRIYPKAVLEREVERYTRDKINDNRAYGELNHPAGPTINLDRACHLIRSLRQEGENWVGRSQILTNDFGRNVAALIADGCNLGVSSRALGTIKKNSAGIMEVQDDLHLATAGDIVADPSAPEAFVRGILENVEYWYDIADGNWKAQQFIEQANDKLHKTTVKKINENTVALFERYLGILTQK